MIPHLAVPFQLAPDGTAAVVAQDSIDDITGCVEVLAATPVGSRLELPAYGIPDLMFTQGVPATQQVADAVAVWEPRAAVTVTASPGPQAGVAITVAARTPQNSR